MKKRDIISYNVVTGLFSAFMLFQVGMYFLQYEIARDMFESLGVPTAIIYPLAIAKFLGLVAIWTNKSRLLKELAYLGYAIDFIAAIAAHAMVGDGGAPAPAVALIILLISYLFNRKVHGGAENSDLV